MAAPVSPSAKDDPVDLGPFMQAYVLKNPFSSDEKDAPNPGSPFQAEPAVLRTSPAPQPLVAVKNNNGMLPLDTGKAHYGSNIQFSEMIRDRNLPIKYVRVKMWLLERYKHDKCLKNLTNSQQILAEVRRVFHDMTGRVLSRIIKFSFPDSRKVFSKYGTFYTGLVKRPRQVDFISPVVRACLNAVENGSDVETAAKQHDMSSLLLSSVLLWMKEGPLEESPTAPTSSGSSTEMEDDDSKDADWKAYGISRRRLPSGSKPDLRKRQPFAPTQKRGNLRMRMKTLDKFNNKTEQSSSTEKRDNSTLPLRKRRRSIRSSVSDNGVSDAKVTRRKPHETPKETKKEPNGENGSVNERLLPSVSMSPPVSLNERLLPSVSMSPPVSSDGAIDLSRSVVDVVPAHLFHPAMVKDEPYDPNYNHHGSLASLPESSRHGNLANLPETSHHGSPINASPRPLPPHSVHSSMAGVYPQVSPAPHVIMPAMRDVMSIAPHPDKQLISHLQAQLQEVKCTLSLQESRSSQLETSLHAAQNDLKHLHAEVQSKENIIRELAKDFQDLSGQFLRVSHKFKSVISDIELKKSM